MLTFDATELINEVSRTTRTTQVITRYFGCWPQTKIIYFKILGRHQIEMVASVSI